MKQYKWIFILFTFTFLFQYSFFLLANQSEKKVKIFVLLYKDQIISNHIHSIVTDLSSNRALVINRWQKPIVTTTHYLEKELKNASRYKSFQSSMDFNTIKTKWNEAYDDLITNQSPFDIITYNCADVTKWLLKLTNRYQSKKNIKRFSGITLPSHIFNSIKSYE